MIISLIVRKATRKVKILKATTIMKVSRKVRKVVMIVTRMVRIVRFFIKKVIRNVNIFNLAIAVITANAFFFIKAN